MRTSLAFLPLAVLLAGCARVAPAPPPAAVMAPGVLHSPWDETPVATTQAPFDCGSAPILSPDITVTGPLDSKKHQLSEDVKDAVYAESAVALEELTRRIVFAADIYRSSGSIPAAQCVTSLLSAAAASRAMTGYMASNAAWEEQNITLRASAIAFLKIRNSGVTTPNQAAAITSWLDGITRRERTFFEHMHCGENLCNLKGHAGLGVAMAAAAVGVADNDRNLYHWSTSQYRTAIGEISPRGMLHYDMKGRFAMLDNLESAAELVQIAEFGEANGDALYGYDNGRVHLLVHTVALGLVDSTPYESATRKHQKSENPIQPWEVAWASVYNRRFPDPVVTGLLHQIGPGGVDMWGGEPWDPEGEPEETIEASR